MNFAHLAGMALCLSRSELAALLLLHSSGGEIFVGQAALARLLGLHARSMERGLNNLIAMGAISHTLNPAGVEPRTCYRLLPWPWAGVDPKVVGRVNKQVTLSRVPQSHPHDLVLANGLREALRLLAPTCNPGDPEWIRWVSALGEARRAGHSMVSISRCLDVLEADAALAVTYATAPCPAELFRDRLPHLRDLSQRLRALGVHP